MWIIKEKAQSWNNEYFRDTVLNGGVFPFIKDLENTLSVKEVIHFCMIRHHVLKLFPHRNCFKTVVHIALLFLSEFPGSFPDLNVCETMVLS